MVNLDAKWRDVDAKIYPWLSAFNQIMRQTALPSIQGDTIYVTSDYSGFHDNSKYIVITILLADLSNCQTWELQRQNIRKKYLAKRRMSYKKLNDKQREAALVPFLEAAGSINGLCASLIINKKIDGLVTTRRTLQKLMQSVGIKGKWNIHEFERMARVAHFVSLFLAGLAQPAMNVIWITDDDEIVGGEERKADCAHLVSAFTSNYILHSLGELCMGTTALDEGDFLEEDFAAIPDLVAGSLSDMMTVISSHGNWIDSAIEIDGEKIKSRLILSWLIRTLKRLCYVNIVFEHLGGTSIGLIPLDLE